MLPLAAAAGARKVLARPRQEILDGLPQIYQVGPPVGEPNRDATFVGAPFGGSCSKHQQSFLFKIGEEPHKLYLKNRRRSNLKNFFSGRISGVL